MRPSAMRDSGNFSKITEAMCTESTNRFVTGQRREEYYEGKITGTGSCLPKLRVTMMILVRSWKHRTNGSGREPGLLPDILR